MEGSNEGGSFTLDVQSTTGGSFTLNLDRAVTVDQLKKLVSRRLKLSKDRICLLHRERQLREGTLEENGLADGARVILLPSVETGLLSQRTENSVMQALESLNDTQVNDFLSGKSPLNLTMRLGDHTMLIQLQLSTLNPGACGRGPSNSVFRARRASDTSPAKKISPKSKAKPDDKQKNKECLEKAFDLVRSLTEIKDLDKLVDKEAEDINDGLMKLRPRPERSPIKSLSKLVSNPVDEESVLDVEKSVKYVPLPSSVKSNLIKTIEDSRDGSSAENNITDPIAANLTSCLCSSLNPGFPCDSECQPAKVDVAVRDDADITDEHNFLTESTLDEYPMENFFNNAVDQGLFQDAEDVEVDRELSTLARSTAGPTGGAHGAVAEPIPSFQTLTDTNKNKRLHYLLHRTSKYKHPISQNKQKAFMQSVVNKHIKRSLSRQDITQASTSRSEPFVVSPRKLTLIQASSGDPEDPQPSTSQQTVVGPCKVIEAPKTRSQTNSSTVTFDSKALMEASKNLTQTLKKLSKEVLVNKSEKSQEEEPLRTKTGAVIESMKHHGKGIYSGTFSGTLNPALQDRYGRPKRDISTIIHILNDLLCATPPLKAPRERKIASPAASSSKSECSCGVSCAYGQCDGHYASTSTAPEAVCTCRQQPCLCKSKQEPKKCKCGEIAACKKCNVAKTLAIDNSKTKCKVEQLRLVMQQKKERREARKLQAGPYIKPPPPSEKNTQAERIDTVA